MVAGIKGDSRQGVCLGVGEAWAWGGDQSMGVRWRGRRGGEIRWEGEPPVPPHMCT